MTRITQLSPNVALDVNGTGKNMTYTIANGDPNLSAILRVYNANTETDGQGVVWQPGTLIVLTIIVPANTTTPATPIPTVDNFGQPISWVIGQVTSKGGSTETTIVSPDWNFSMVN